jgi:hypothetical protein
MRILDMDCDLLCGHEQNEHARGKGKVAEEKLCRERRNGNGVMRMLMLMRDRASGVRDDDKTNTA